MPIPNVSINRFTLERNCQPISGLPSPFKRIGENNPPASSFAPQCALKAYSNATSKLTPTPLYLA